MEARLLTEPELLAAEERWDSLLSRSAADSFFLRHAVLTAWWRCFGAGKELFVVEVTDGGETVGFAPLCIVKERVHGILPMREVSFLGRERLTADYLDFIAEPGREVDVYAAVMQTLLDHRERWDALRISDVIETSGTLRLLEGTASTYGIELADGGTQTCPYLPLPRTWEEFMASCSGNMRSNLRRREKKLAGLGVRFREQRGADLPVALDALFDLHGARWSVAGRTGNFVDPRVRAFHHQIAPMLDREGSIALWTAEHQGRIIAALYGFRHRGKLLYYQAGLAPEWMEHGAGFALMAHAIKSCIAEGLVEFDYLRGEEDYKRRWTDKSRRTITKIALKPGLRASAWRSLGKARRRAAEAKRALMRMVRPPTEPPQPATA